MLHGHHRCNIACPGIRKSAPISALIKPIGLCSTQNAQKKFRTRPTIFYPPPTGPKFRWPIYYIYHRGGGIVGQVRNCFGAFWVPQSPIGLISAKIGALCRIPGHANVIVLKIISRGWNPDLIIYILFGCPKH